MAARIFSFAMKTDIAWIPMEPVMESQAENIRRIVTNGCHTSD